MQGKLTVLNHQVVRCSAVRPLDAARKLARARHHEGKRQQPLFVDAFAEVLSNTSPLVSSALTNMVRRREMVTCEGFVPSSDGCLACRVFEHSCQES